MSRSRELDQAIRQEAGELARELRAARAGGAHHGYASVAELGDAAYDALSGPGRNPSEAEIARRVIELAGLPSGSSDGSPLSPAQLEEIAEGAD